MTSTSYSHAKETYNNTFSSFLKEVRRKNNLSQEVLCSYLRQESSLFRNLDTTTISRWERGVNIPSLAKQAEIVELYDKELTSIYATDPLFINECRELVSIPEVESTESKHPYYTNDIYQIKDIDINDDSFYVILKMIMRYENNPTLILTPPFESFPALEKLKISLATAFNGQIVGHALFMEISSQSIFELINIKSNLKELISELSEKKADGMLVLSSAGATTELENGIMSSYMHRFVRDKKLRYLCFSICDDVFIKKLQIAKIEPFKIRSVFSNGKRTSIYSYVLNRSELMANRFLLKLAVISPNHLYEFIADKYNGG
ncbi:helix-turn-helix domain-containing protein [Shewanella colwelliana]|uniref:helix-turn-helix domain-containing protein n=1 Tax=Shewanella colwelliana TaxID=23 RepID=UPI003736FC10